MTEHEELDASLGQPARLPRANQSIPMQDAFASAPNKPTREVGNTQFSQWVIGSNDQYQATGATRDTLPPGVYRAWETQTGICFERMNTLTDKLVDLKDSAASEIIEGIRTFWKSEDKFKARGILYKRGVLLWGPPGGGKTCLVAQLVAELVGQGGMVFMCQHPRVAVDALSIIRRIEPSRRLIVIEEDIEEIIREFGEHSLLALLDGENQIGDVVHIATTNYPADLGARIINRPSRFDEVRKIGMPSAGARDAYFVATAPELGELERRLWVSETDGFSIAHLRELVVAVFCMGRTYQETLARMERMRLRPKDREDGFSGSGVSGFDPQKINGHAHE